MTPLVFGLILLHLSATVAAQVWMKRAMGESEHETISLPRSVRRRLLGFAVGAMALSFFVTLGLLQDFELSYLFPFQALTVIIITLSARVFLKEKLTRRLIFGLVLISCGVALVARS